MTCPNCDAYKDAIKNLVAEFQAETDKLRRADLTYQTRETLALSISHTINDHLGPETRQ